MKIYVVGSKDKCFFPLDDIREKFIVDDVHDGDNIDILNKWYCELTGLYYLWKHCDDEIVGIEHYRRYFADDKWNVLGKNKISSILTHYDVICCEYKCPYSVIEHYKRLNFGYIELFRILAEVDNFEPFKTYLSNRSWIVFNMCITKKNILDEYCSWLFNALSLNDYEMLQKPRIAGYLAEVLFGAWLYMKQYKLYKSNYKVLK